jgi:muconolactone delta-isomerase
MQFLVLTERYLDQFSEADFAAVIPAETETVRGLYTDGVVRQIWLRGDTRGACVLIEAASQADAESIVSTFPLAQRKMSEFRIIPLQPYGGFGPR